MYALLKQMYVALRDTRKKVSRLLNSSMINTGVIYDDMHRIYMQKNVHTTFAGYYSLNPVTTVLTSLL